MVATQTTVTCHSNHLSYKDACKIANQASATSGHDTIRLELQRVVETTTAALARLIALRRNLRRSGRDLRIAGLHGQAENLYEFNRMAGLLPRNQ
jgi:ABC-type transporter Mla MlaB component